MSTPDILPSSKSPEIVGSSDMKNYPSIIGEIEPIAPINVLKDIKLSNVIRLIIGQLNINSLRNKFETLKYLIKGNLDILIITESKLDNSFPTSQFFIDGYTPPYRLDRDSLGGGVLIYVREDIPSKELKSQELRTQLNFEGIFLEINLRKSKWLLFGGYNPRKDDIAIFLNQLSTNLNMYTSKYDNLILLGDFNSETSESYMKEFCETYNLKKLINEPTCFKNPLNPSLIDLILTNRLRCFEGSRVVETGLSDHHKLTITILKQFFPKQKPTIIEYRDYKHFEHDKFQNELLSNLANINRNDKSYDIFEKVFLETLNKYAPTKTKQIRANNAPFMNRTLSKAVMTRSRLRNKYLKTPNPSNKTAYNKYRNFCVRLFKKEKKNYYENINVKDFRDNKKFWKLVKPFFSEKQSFLKKITLSENEEIISDDTKVAEIMNTFFSSMVENLQIPGYKTIDNNNHCSDQISNIINKYEDHPSIVIIKNNVDGCRNFNFPVKTENEFLKQVNQLNRNKPTTSNNIPNKVLIDNSNIVSPFLTNIYNDSLYRSSFPSALQLADITPVYKRGDRTNKCNYRPISILPSVSKIFERFMSEDICIYMNEKLSPYLCGFRKGYSTQSCLLVMLERWKEA